MRAIWSLLTASTLSSLTAGCPLVEVANQRDGRTADVAAPVCPTSVSADTIRIFESLSPHCAGCHASGPRGYFASVATFQSLVVAEPRLVVPGAGAGSAFTALLRGTGRGAFSQMPPAGPSYEALYEAGQAAVSVEAIVAWIDALPTQARSAAPDVDAPRATRLSADQIRVALFTQLGLEHDDFFTTAREYGIEMAEARDEGAYPLLGSDDIPAPRQRTTAERHQGLGGGSVIGQRPEDRSSSTNFVHTLVQVSQAWCMRALRDDNNTALFLSRAARDDESPAARRDTLARWSLHFHSQPLPDEDAVVYDALWLRVRAEEGNDATTAWAAVCSAFIRNPLWVYY